MDPYDHLTDLPTARRLLAEQSATISRQGKLLTDAHRVVAHMRAKVAADAALLEALREFDAGPSAPPPEPPRPGTRCAAHSPLTASTAGSPGMRILLEFVDLGPECEKIVIEWLHERIAMKGAADVQTAGPLRYVREWRVVENYPIGDSQHGVSREPVGASAPPSF